MCNFDCCLKKYKCCSVNIITCKIYTVLTGGMSGLQNMMRQLQQGAAGAAGGLGSLMSGFGGKS